MNGKVNVKPNAPFAADSSSRHAHARPLHSCFFVRADDV
jgi:hypothetical protein